MVTVIAGPGPLLVKPDAEVLIRWLNCGPIQHQDGGLIAWCDRNFAPAYVYPEISGYFLTAQASIAERSEVNHNRIARCARFLANRIRAGQLEARSHEGGVSYNFDLGMISTGLLRAHVVFGEDVADEGLRLAALLRDQILSSGALPTWRRDASSPQRGQTWSTAGSLHLAKCSQCLLLAEAQGLDGARAAADTLVETTLKKLRAGSAPWTCPGSTQIHLHPVLYCVEGLWVYHRATGHAPALTAAVELLSYVSSHMVANGRLPAVVDEARATEWAAEQSDTLAQLVRAALLLDDPMGIASAGCQRLNHYFQVTNGFGTAVEYRLGSGHLNTWATIFSAQALMLAGFGKTSIAWEDLA